MQCKQPILSIAAPIILLIRHRIMKRLQGGERTEIHFARDKKKIRDTPSVHTSLDWHRIPEKLCVDKTAYIDAPREYNTLRREPNVFLFLRLCLF